MKIGVKFNMRKASRIYKRKSRTNLETLIILVGAIIILGVAFYLARERSYIPPETQITQKEEVVEETSITEIHQEIPPKKAISENEEPVKIAEPEIKEEIKPEEKTLPAESAVLIPPKTETDVKVVEETELKKNIYTIQIGAFKAEKNALHLAEEIKNKGYQTFVIKGKSLYKVQVEEFKTYKEAEKVVPKIKELGCPTFITTK